MHYYKDHQNKYVGVIYTKIPQVHWMLNNSTGLNTLEDLEYCWTPT